MLLFIVVALLPRLARSQVVSLACRDACQTAYTGASLPCFKHRVSSACVSRNEGGIFNSDTLLSCADRCLNDFQCVSFEFDDDRGQCQLSHSCVVGTVGGDRFDLYELHCPPEFQASPPTLSAETACRRGCAPKADGADACFQVPQAHQACPSRIEGGESKPDSVDLCARYCLEDDQCVSFVYSTTGFCHLSHSCTTQNFQAMVDNHFYAFKCSLPTTTTITTVTTTTTTTFSPTTTTVDNSTSTVPMTTTANVSDSTSSLPTTTTDSTTVVQPDSSATTLPSDPSTTQPDPFTTTVLPDQSTTATLSNQSSASSSAPAISTTTILFNSTSLLLAASSPSAASPSSGLSIPVIVAIAVGSLCLLLAIIGLLVWIARRKDSSASTTTDAELTDVSQYGPLPTALTVNYDAPPSLNGDDTMALSEYHAPPREFGQ